MAILRLIHSLHLRLVGIALLASAISAFIAPGVAFDTGVAIPTTPVWVLATLAGLGLFLLVPWWLPRGLRRPTRGRDLAWLAVHVAAAVLHAMLDPAIFALLLPTMGLSAGAIATNLGPPFWIVPPLVLMLALVVQSLRGSRPTDRAASPTPTPAKPKRTAKPPEPKLPALGAAMKLYVVADWTILRLMGVGLMATAYLIWTLIDTDRIAQAEHLSHGKPPIIALWIYGGAGAILCLPFLLPGRIARPRNVIFGMLKAILLVGAAYVLIAPMNLAITEFTPKLYHPTLLETVPRLFKAICGVAVTAALLISFFRQLGGLPAVDYTGAPKVHLTPAQLYDLRKSRMQV